MGPRQFFTSPRCRLATPREARHPLSATSVPSLLPSTDESEKVALPPTPSACPVPRTVPTQPKAHTYHAHLSWGQLETGQRVGVGIPEDSCTKQGNISTSHQQKWPSCHGYGRARLWAQASPGRSPQTPQYSQWSQASPRGMVVRWVPQRAEAVSLAVRLSRGRSGAYMASGQHRWPKVGEGLATEDGQAGGSRCSWGSATLICLAVMRAAGRQQL